MKLSTKGRYAVMAIIDLAMNSMEKNSNPITLSDIASRQEISLSYLEQLFAKLRRANVVKSARGPGGGYLLARSPQDIHITDIILAVDEPIRATRCKGNGSPNGCMTANKGRCLTHHLWEELGHQIHTFLDSVSVADVMDKGKFASNSSGKPMNQSCGGVA